MTAVWEILCTYDKDIFRSPPQSGGERFKQRNPPPAAGDFCLHIRAVITRFLQALKYRAFHLAEHRASHRRFRQ